MSDPAPDVLAHALELSRAMRDAAVRGDWAALAELETRRAPLVSEPLPHDERTRDVLAELLELDRAIRQAVGAARDAVAREWQASRDAQRALRSYTEG